MEGKVNYTAVGVFVVLLTALLLVLVFWLTTYTHATKYKPYQLFVHEDVTGLSVDGPVRFNGVQVGFVSAIRLDERNPKLVRLLLQIDPAVRVTTSTYAMLNAQGITGVVYVNLKAGDPGEPLLKAKPGDRYPIIPAKPSLLMQLSSVLPEITQDIHRLSSSLAKVLDTDNQVAISDSLKNMQQFTKTLSDNSALIEKNLTGMHQVLNNLSVATKGLPVMMGSINQLSVHLNHAAETINHAAKQSNLAIVNFSNQVLPKAQEAITGFHEATISFHEFINHLNQNPTMLIRGTRHQALGPGE